MDRPLDELRAAVDRLCDANNRTAGAKFREAYLGRHYLLVELRRPVVIEGQVIEPPARPPGEISILDLMADFESSAANS